MSCAEEDPEFKFPPLIRLPELPAGWRYLWPGEVIPRGAQMLDPWEERFLPVSTSVGSTMPRDPLHASLWFIPVRVRSTHGLVP